MKIDQIQTILRNRFTAPIPPWQRRRIILWQDDAAGFADIVDDLDLPGVQVLKWDGRNSFAVKRQLEEVDLNGNYLVYAPFPLPQFADDWLLDIRLYAEPFSADPVSIIACDLGINDSDVKALIRQNLDFFNNQDRYNRIRQLACTPWTEANFELALLAAATRSKSCYLEDILKALFAEGVDESENTYWLQVSKWPGAECFWRHVDLEYGYRAGEPSLKKFILSLLITSMLRGFSGVVPSGWDAYRVRNAANTAVFIDHWMSDKNHAQTYDRLAREMEAELDLRQKVEDWDPDSYAECDQFPEFDKALIRAAIAAILKNPCDRSLWLNRISHRRSKHWYSAFAKIYDALEAALHLTSMEKALSEVLSAAKTRELFLAYTDDLYLMDYWYRRFSAAFDQIESTEALKPLQAFVEKFYVNALLSPLSVAWSTKVTAELSTEWSLPGIPQQHHFFRDQIEPLVGKASRDKVYVIVSDALRYEVAVELAEHLNSEVKGSAELSVMQGVIPSVTRLGMAALLPGKTWTIKEDGQFLLDGANTEGIDQRRMILQKALPESDALPLKDFMKKSRDEAREFVKGKRLIFLYHDAIDATGEKAPSEHLTFSAAEQALRDIEKAVRFLVNTLSATQIIITADHGFLFQREPLAAHEKIEKDAPGGVSIGRRFVLTKNTDAPDGVHAVRLSYLLGPDTPWRSLMPRGIQRFKLPGPGSLYVHGGPALQEIALPVVKFKALRIAGGLESLQTKVDVRLVSESRKITGNQFFLDLFQTQAAGEKVKPRQVKIAMWDLSDGEKRISDEKLLIADRTAENPAERTFRVFLLLKSGHYDKAGEYFLRIIDAELDTECARIPFQISLGIANDFDDFS